MRFSGTTSQLDAILLSPSDRRWLMPCPAEREHIRADIVHAVRMNAFIDRQDPDGRKGWPTAVRSDPVYLPTWSE